MIVDKAGIIAGWTFPLLVIPFTKSPLSLPVCKTISATSLSKFVKSVNMKSVLFYSALFYFVTYSISASTQSVGIGTTSPNSSAVLDIMSNNKGILVPRMTQSERIAIPPVAGLLVYQTDIDSSFFWHDGVAWVQLLSGKSGWSLSGNTNTKDTHFIGTADDRNVLFKRNQIQSGLIDTTNTSFGVGGLSSITSAIHNTAFGGYALRSNTVGNANSAFGYGALSANLVGIRNTAVGVNALSLNNVGTDNTAVGTSSLVNNTTGGLNTAIGVQSLNSNSTGNGNVALGYNALYTNTTGAGNTASGFYALVSNTSGSLNTATGLDAMNGNVTGYNNTANGVRSLYYNTTGAGNTAMGLDALYSNESGGNNTSVGFQSLYSNATGQSNSASGKNALYYNTEGSFNTAFGVDAGSANITGSNNTAIGYNANMAYDNLTNTTVIGSEAKAYQSNTVILGNNASVGIGTFAPHSSAKLSIVSTNQGILIPTMSSLERLAISSPAEGLMVYDTDTHSFWHYNASDSRWINMQPQMQQYPSVQKTINGGEAGDKFGYSVFAGLHDIVIGAPGRSGNRGSVIFGDHQTENVFDFTEVTGIGYNATDWFGYAVAINKDWGGSSWIGGAPFDDDTFTNQGSVCIYTDYTNPLAGDKLYSPTPQANEVFGSAVGIAGHSFANSVFIIIGAPGKNSGAGGAYIYWHNGSAYTLMQTIEPVAPNPTDSFGLAVSLTYNYLTGEGWAFVGAPNDDVFAVNDGSVSVYKRNLISGAWEFQFRMSSADPVANGHFGYSVASNMLCESGVVIGEPGYSSSPTTGLNKGRIQYSAYSVGSFQNPSVIDIGQYNNNYLGSSVSVAGNQACDHFELIAGAKSGPIGTTVNNWGMARFYTMINNSGTWIKNGKTFDMEGGTGWQFGFSVAVGKNGNVVTGSPSASIGNNLLQGKVKLESFPGF